MIKLLDYGAGNSLSIQRSLRKLGHEFEVATDLDSATDKSRLLIIPGVGSFAAASQKLEEIGMLGFRNLNPSCRPSVLGICLGMQVLFDSGSEGGVTQGLGLIEGCVDKIEKYDIGNRSLRNTLIGWEQMEVLSDCFGEKRLGLMSHSKYSFYHVHSYRVHPKKNSNIMATYPGDKCFIPTVVGSAAEKCVGLQYHPEKSGNGGLSLFNHIIETLIDF